MTAALRIRGQRRGRAVKLPRMNRKDLTSAIRRIRYYAENGAVDVKEITRRRDALGLSQAEAARLAEMSPQWWSDLEKGKHDNPRVMTLVRIAVVLGCKVDDLLRK